MNYAIALAVVAVSGSVAIASPARAAILTGPIDVDPDGFVETPLGRRHRTCVHIVPSGTVIKDGLVEASGAAESIPLCAVAPPGPILPTGPATDGPPLSSFAIGPALPPMLGQPIEAFQIRLHGTIAGPFAPAQEITQFKETITVPAPPTNTRQNVYFHVGLTSQRLNYPVRDEAFRLVLVLEYGIPGGFSMGPIWTAYVLYTEDMPTAGSFGAPHIFTPPIEVTPGDKLEVDARSSRLTGGWCATDHLQGCDWTITARNVSRNQHIGSLTPRAHSRADVAVPGEIMVPWINSCDNLPAVSSPGQTRMQFDNIQVLDRDFNNVADRLVWGPNYDSYWMQPRLCGRDSEAPRFQVFPQVVTASLSFVPAAVIFQSVPVGSRGALGALAVCLLACGWVAATSKSRT